MWKAQHSQGLGLSQPSRPCCWALVSTLTAQGSKLTSHSSWRRYCFHGLVSYQYGILMLLCLCWSHLGIFLSFLSSPPESKTSGFLFPASSVSQADSSLFVLSHFPSTRHFLVSLGSYFPETNSHIFPFQYSTLIFEFHIPKAMFLSKSSSPPHSAAVLTMLFLHYFSYVLFIVLNQPFVSSAVLLQFVDIPGPWNYAKSAIWLVPVSPQVMPNVFSQGWQKLLQGPSCL